MQQNAPFYPVSTNETGSNQALKIFYTSIEQYFCEAVWVLKNLISIPSFSKEENKTASFIFDYLSGKGLKPNRKGNNIWAIDFRSKDLPTILFNSHHDTVKPTSSWALDPFTPVVREGKLFGLGSNDAGASVVSQMMAFMILVQDENRPYNLVYSATAEEESSSEGGIESILGDLGFIDLVLVGEPTQMQPAVAEKGLMVLECKVHGKTGHAARNEGINAIYLAMEDIRKIQGLKFPKTSALLGDVRLSVTAIKAGNQHNVVPDVCDYLVDVRSNENYTHKEIIDAILEKTKYTEITVSLSNQKTSVIPLFHPVVKRATELGLTYFGSSTTSDQMVIPHTSIKIGPGNSARSHSADEYIGLDEIRHGIEMYVKLLDGLVI